MMKLVLDAMGGDNAPQAVVQGAISAAQDFTDCQLVLVGQEEAVRKAFAAEGCQSLPERISIVNATEVIEMCDDPATAFRKKKDSSMTGA
jgi:glycerol-3-phosphate acyltransferase PlsX